MDESSLKLIWKDDLQIDLGQLDEIQMILILL